MLPQHLYGYRPVEVFVDPAPHLTHAPATQQRLQGVPSGELEPSLHAGLQSDSGDAIIRIGVSSRRAFRQQAPSGLWRGWYG